jgi:hypothetical protein
MKTLIFLFLIIFAFSGCKTQGLITQTSTEIHYRDTTIYVNLPVYIDTTIFVPIPGFKDSVRIIDSVRIQNGFAYMKTLHKETGLIGVDVTLNNSELSVVAYLTDSTILFNLKDTLNFHDSVKIYNAIKDQVTTNIVVLQPVKYIPKFYKFSFWLLIVELIILALFAFYKLGYFGILGNLLKRLQFSK